METIIGDVLTILRIIYAAVDGMKSNSTARSLLLAKLDAIQLIITNISDPPSNTPTASALLDLKDTLQKALDTIRKQEKRNTFQWMVKHSLEDADLIRLGDRVSQGQQQLAVAIAADNANQKAENAQEIGAILSDKVESLPTVVTAGLASQRERLSALSSQLYLLGRQLENSFPTIEHYSSRILKSRAPSAPPAVGWGLVSSIIQVGGAILTAIQSVKNNRKEATALGRRVQVALDVAESMSSELMTKQFRREEVTQLLECLDRCAVAVGAQTSKGVGSRVVGIQTDGDALRVLSKELSECLLRLGLELQLYEKHMDSEILFTVSSNATKLEERIRKATESSAKNLSTGLAEAENEMERLKWMIARIPFSEAVGGVGRKIRNLSEQISLLANEVKVDDAPDVVKSLSINKGVVVAVPAPLWSQIVVGIGKIIHVYDFRSGHHEFELGRHNGQIQDLAVSLDGKKVASTGQDCVVKVWDMTKRKELVEVGLGQSALYSQSFVCFTGLPQQHLTCSGSSFGYSGKDVYFHGDARVVLSEDGSIMAEAKYRSISLIATASMTTIRNIAVKEEPGCVALTSDGKYLYIRQTYPREVTVLRVEDGAVIGKWVLKDQVEGDQLFLDEQEKVHVIAGTQDGAVKIWDTVSGMVQVVLKYGDSCIPIVAISVAKTIAPPIIITALREDGIVQIWNLATQKLVIQLGVGEDYPEHQSKRIVMLSPDGSQLFVRRGDIIATCTLHGLSEAIGSSSPSILSPPPPPPSPPLRPPT